MCDQMPWPVLSVAVVLRVAKFHVNSRQLQLVAEPMHTGSPHLDEAKAFVVSIPMGDLYSVSVRPAV